MRRRFTGPGSIRAALGAAFGAAALFALPPALLLIAHGFTN